MAVRILQIANSSLFNLQNRNIETINEAVVLVGFTAVRELAISVSVIEELLKGDHHGQLGLIMAHAFHAAAQAKFLAQQQQVPGTEEVFVAALLKQVGDMAFWARAERDAEQLQQRLLGGMPPHKAQREVLGFELDQLGRLLAEDWSLGDLVTAVLDGKHGDLLNVASVVQGHDVALTLETHDWESAEVEQLITGIADQLAMKAEDVRACLHENLSTAREMIEHFGINKPVPHRPVVSAADEVSAEDSAEGGSGPIAPIHTTTYQPAYNATALLAVLQEIAEDLEGGAARDELMQQIVQGVADTLGLANVYFALFTPDRKKLLIKYSASEARVGTQVDLSTLPVDVLDMQATKVEVRDGNQLVVSVFLNGKPVGVLFARAGSATRVEAEQQQGFRQFAQQIGLVLMQTR